MPDGSHDVWFIAILKRQWWLIALTIIAAILIALVASAGESEPLYEATAVIVVDATTLSRHPYVPRPDDLILEASTDAFASQVASAADVTTSSVAAGLRVFSQGATQTRLVVAFRSPDESQAATVAVAAARALVERSTELSGPEMTELDRRVKDTEGALDRVRRIDNQNASRASASLQLDLIRTAWEMRMQLYEDRLALRRIRSSYMYNGNVRTADIAPLRERGRIVASAFVLGAIVGFALAVARDSRSRANAHAEDAA